MPLRIYYAAGNHDMAERMPTMKTIRLLMLFTACAALAATFFGGCRKDKKKGAGQEDDVVRGKIIASLEKENLDISLEKVNRAWQLEVLDEHKPGVAQYENWQQRFLDTWIEQEVMARLAREKKLDQTAEFKLMRNIKETSLLAALYYRDYISPELQKVDVRTGEAEQYFEEHKKDYFFNDRFFVGWRNVRRIVLDADSDPSELYRKLQADPSGFAATAREYSMDKETAMQGGDMGRIFIGDPRLDPGVLPVYFFTPKGEVSHPVAGAAGWHIVYVTDASPADRDFLPLADDRLREVEAALKFEKMQEKRTKLMARYKKDMGLKVVDSLVPEIAPDWVLPSSQPAPEQEQPAVPPPATPEPFQLQ